jgi:hypothetical protein
MAGSSEHGNDIVEDPKLDGSERVVRFIGNGKVRAHTCQSRGLRLCDRRGQRQRIVDGSTDAMHSGVDLEMDRMSVAAGRRDGLQLGHRVNGEFQAVRHCGNELVGGLLAEHQDRAVDAGGTQRHPFLHQGDAQSCGATAQRGTGNFDRTVAVAIGLDHGPHLRRRRNCAQLGDIVFDCAEIDLGPRPTAHNNSSSTAGIRSGRSPATRPWRCPRRPAWPWTHAPAAAA